MKSAVFPSLAIVLAALSVSGCDSQEKAAAPREAGAQEGISISDGRLVLPAVKGNPGAVYFTVHNDSADALAIQGAEVKGAKSAMIHQTEMANGMSGMHAMPTVAVRARSTLAFKPGGLHVMAMDLDNTLAKGATTDVKLTFASGEEAVFPVEILAAGDAR